MITSEVRIYVVAPWNNCKRGVPDGVIMRANEKSVAKMGLHIIVDGKQYKGSLNNDGCYANLRHLRVSQFHPDQFYDRETW